MGRWTPLILMAGGLAILLGTLLGISFPMGGQQNANLIGGRTSKVLPANLENNPGGNASRRAASANANSGEVAQNNAPDTTTTAQSGQETTTDNTQNNSGSANQGANEPIRALW